MIGLQLGGRPLPPEQPLEAGPRRCARSFWFLPFFPRRPRHVIARLAGTRAPRRAWPAGKRLAPGALPCRLSAQPLPPITRLLAWTAPPAGARRVRRDLETAAGAGRVRVVESATAAFCRILERRRITGSVGDPDARRPSTTPKRSPSIPASAARRSRSRMMAASRHGPGRVGLRAPGAPPSAVIR